MIRIDELDTTLTPSMTHVFPVMKDGRTSQMSVSQVHDLIRSELMGGATPEELDTLFEIAQSLGDDPDFVGTVTTMLAAKSDLNQVVRHDVPQALTNAQKARASENIGSGYLKITIAVAELDAPAVDPQFYHILFRDSNYRPNSGGMYRKQASEPTHSLKFQNANGTWYAFDGSTITTAQAGAAIDGITDDTAAIHAAVTFAKTRIKPHLIISPGTHAAASTVTIDLPDYSTLTFNGSVKSTKTSGVAVRIGSTSTVKSTFGLEVYGIDVYCSAIQVGVTVLDLLNHAFGKFHFRRVLNGDIGVQIVPTAANGGFSYNQLWLGHHHDSTVNVALGAAGVGYCNDNMFYGGSFNHSSTWPAATPSVNLSIAHWATSELNNNRFYGPSFEDNQTATYARAVNMAGQNNVIYDPRMENPADQANYLINLLPEAAKCRIEAHSFVVVKTNVQDQSGRNTVITTEGWTLVAPTPNSVGHSVLTLKSYATTNAKVFRGLDSSGAETSSILGTGAFSGTSFAATGAITGASMSFTGAGSVGGQMTATGGHYAGEATGYVRSYNAGNYGRTDYRKTSGGTENAIVAYNSANTSVGGATYSETAFNIVTSSDYRLWWKQNAKHLEASGDFIDRLKVYDFPLANTAGFLAHELQEVSPVSVVGEKDAVDKDGNPIYQAVDYSSPQIIANVIAELQSLRKDRKAVRRELELLRHRVAELEGGK